MMPVSVPGIFTVPTLSIGGPDSLQNARRSAVAGSSPSYPLADGVAGFANYLNQALGEVDQAQKISDQMSSGMLLGSVELHQATIAMEKASLTLRTFVQVRDKVLEAYQEVMRMQV